MLPREKTWTAETGVVVPTATLGSVIARMFASPEIATRVPKLAPACGNGAVSVAQFA